jgi:hypothetical protein
VADDELVDDPAEDEERGSGDRHAEHRMDAGIGDVERDVAAEHDEIALRDVDDLHDAPDQRHAIGRQAIDRADQHAVDQKLQGERRRLPEDEEVIHAVGVRTLSSSLRA